MSVSSEKQACRTTICITTLNRPDYLERTLRYYRDTGFGGVILIGDGSVGDMAAANQRVVEKFSGLIQVELLPAADITQAATMKVMAEMVTTDFAVYSGDDDYLIPKGLADCEEALDGAPNYISMHGRAIVLNMSGVYGTPASAGHYTLPRKEEMSSLTRLSNFFRDDNVGIVGIFCLHRAAAWREMHRNCDLISDKAIGGEITPCAVSAALGPAGEIDTLYLVRQIHTDRYHLQSGASWMLRPEFGPSCQIMLEQLQKIVGSTDDDFKDGKQADILPTVIWNTWLSYLCRGCCSTPSAPQVNWEGPVEAVLAWADRSQGLQPVLDNLAVSPESDSRPRMLINWGNPYVINESVAPALPDLAKRFQIVLLLVNYHLTKEIHDKALEWKKAGYIKDLLIAPSHGGSFAAHAYIRNIAGQLHAWKFDIFLTISAMQPYERYLTDWILPAHCLRVVLWPHPTNLFLHAALADSVTSNAPRNQIEAEISKARQRSQPSILKELAKPSLTAVRIAVFILLAEFASLFTPKRGPAEVRAAPLVAIPGLRLLRARPMIGRPSRFAHWPAFIKETYAFLYLSAYWAKRITFALLRRVKWSFAWFRRRVLRKSYFFVSTALAPTLLARILHLDLDNLYKRFYYTCDRYVYPLVMIGRSLPFEKLDAVTQIGTSRFDACLFFNEDDARHHRVLYDRPDFHTIRYLRPQEFEELPPLDAVLLPFTLHDRSDITPELLEIYRRDLMIALKASGAAEAHIRLHPGRSDEWLAGLVEQLRGMGVPCRLVGAERPVSVEAGRYRGVIGAVSAALRDAHLANSHIFVVGSMGLSLTHFPKPREIVGFSSSIGWIEADGKFDPAIFRSGAERGETPPTLTDLVGHLFETKRKNNKRDVSYTDSSVRI